MVDIPDSLRSVFSADIRERDGSYLIEIPSGEIQHGAVETGETYRIAILESPAAAASREQNSSRVDRSQSSGGHTSSEPPVAEGELRKVTIETIGDKGDGIAKVERGYVVIVPSAQQDEQPTIEIEQVQENVAFASVIEDEPRAV